MHKKIVIVINVVTRAFVSLNANGYIVLLQDRIVDTRFCTHDLIKEDDWNDHPCTPKIMLALHALIHSLHIIKMILRF